MSSINKNIFNNVITLPTEDSVNLDLKDLKSDISSVEERLEVVKTSFDSSISEMFITFNQMVSKLDKSDGSIELMHSKILNTESLILRMQSEIEKVRAKTHRYAYLVEEQIAINRYFQNGGE